MASIAPPKRLDTQTAALALLRVFFVISGDPFNVTGRGLLDTKDVLAARKKIREGSIG